MDISKAMLDRMVRPPSHSDILWVTGHKFNRIYVDALHSSPWRMAVPCQLPQSTSCWSRMMHIYFFMEINNSLCGILALRCIY